MIAQLVSVSGHVAALLLKPEAGSAQSQTECDLSSIRAAFPIRYC